MTVGINFTAVHNTDRTIPWGSKEGLGIDKTGIDGRVKAGNYKMVYHMTQLN